MRISNQRAMKLIDKGAKIVHSKDKKKEDIKEEKHKKEVLENIDKIMNMIMVSSKASLMKPHEHPELLEAIKKVSKNIDEKYAKMDARYAKMSAETAELAKIIKSKDVEPKAKRLKVKRNKMGIIHSIEITASKEK